LHLQQAEEIMDTASKESASKVFPISNRADNAASSGSSLGSRIEPWDRINEQLSEFCVAQGLAGQPVLEDINSLIPVWDRIKGIISKPEFGRRMPVVHSFGIKVQLRAVQAVLGVELENETSDPGAFSDWALAYIAAAAGCRFWDKNGDPPSRQFAGKFARFACGFPKCTCHATINRRWRGRNAFIGPRESS
jgi:hypothetical protein